eukprot:CAMPEP_0171111688 /NCGR_PEP_ID=MMETSP0766_2-20121228/76171_1 /TAXON_ID=439317 /ORGANISM="Gambierdiscus australes, Strain CAWD 149" /LENGTH=48 /DNA_ID= /DNA_START= /DNA_END= /DNA_ORIENTATION=
MITRLTMNGDLPHSERRSPLNQAATAPSKAPLALAVVAPTAVADAKSA